ncbi:MAG: hypothetical protein Q9190_003474 [Brigantiaea leucoxantha]
MPDRPLTVLTYAASASLAAIALVYLFSPNQLIDGDSTIGLTGTRKKGVVGLVNPANDCFINAVLQSLAGLGDLRLYLIREVHRRQLDDSALYSVAPDRDEKGRELDVRRLLSLQRGEVTQGLKEMIDQLNERPIYRKTISAQNFVRVLEHSFGTRISRTQQDAQELLQIIAERLSEEYHAGEKARKRARKCPPSALDGLSIQNLSIGVGDGLLTPTTEPSVLGPLPSDCANESEVQDSGDDGCGFPLEGRTEARVECQHCHFMPKASSTSFVMLNLMVPQKSVATLNECFDAHFKTEYIDDYKCDKCRLNHALETLQEEMTHAKLDEQRALIQSKMASIQRALIENPEKPPDRVDLPDTKYAPKRKIARHVKITGFPKILVLHLSRSMFNPRSSSQKNSAKVSFPEGLPIGGILHRKNYKLLGMVTHKGTHNTGHYECFRRQHLYPPRSNPHIDYTNGPFSPTRTPCDSAQPSPKASESLRPSAERRSDKPLDLPEMPSPSSASVSPQNSSMSLPSPSTRPSSSSMTAPAATVKKGSQPPEPPTSMDAPTIILPPPRVPSNLNAKSSAKCSSSSIDLSRFRRKKKKLSDRWWRISDDKVKECRTNDVLSMQRDVYMLFYEMERESGSSG